MKIMFCGDSTGVSASHTPSLFISKSPFTECDVASDLLKEMFWDGAFTFDNQSIGGTSIGQWCNGDASIGMPSFADRVAANPSVDMYCIELGINDAIQNHTTTGFTWAVNQMVTIARAAGKKIMFGTPNAVIYPGRPEVNVLLEQFKNIITSTCASLSVPVVDHWAAMVATGNWTKLLADGIHPNEQFYRFKGHLLFMSIAFQ